MHTRTPQPSNVNSAESEKPVLDSLPDLKDREASLVYTARLMAVEI